MTDVNDAALAFATRFGSFCLYFDATQNHASPDFSPWTLVVDDRDDLSWGSLTAEAAVELASAEMSARGKL
jgi:hypothetical protein